MNTQVAIAPSLNDTIAAAIAAAAAMTHGAQANAAGQANLPTSAPSTSVTTGSPGAALSLEDSVAGLTVDGFIKLKYEGIYFKEDPTPFQEILVRIRGSEIAPHRAVRFGNPATYKRSYDGQFEARTGRPWHEVVAQARAADPRCTGDYAAFDLPFHIVKDIKSMMVPDKVLAPAGSVVGYSTAITAGKDTKAFVKAVVLPLGKDNLIEGVIKLKKTSNDSGKWGLLEFGDIANWKVVPEQGE